jgi:membrane associated rhomboid family serine protease
VSAGGQELFVVCKNCGSEVSPYITECPYCGNRLRKRAPKIDREGRPPKRARRRPPALLTRLRRDEIPGIRPDTRPYATIALLVAGLLGTILWRTSLGDTGNDLVVHGKLGSHWWHLFTAVFAYDNTGYAFITLSAIALFGWLLERRHGPLVVLGLFLAGGVGGLAATAAVYPVPFALGASGGALALLCAWALPDLRALLSGEDVDADLFGVAAIFAVLVLMPLAVTGASWVAGGVGVAVGLVAGLPLSRLAVR